LGWQRPAAAILLASGSAKLADVRAFEATLISLGVASRPTHLSRGLAIGLSAGEALLGLVSLVGVWRAFIDGCIFALMLVFAMVTVFAVSRRRGLRCRCFGALRKSQFGTRSLVESLTLAILAAVVLVGGIKLDTAFEFANPATALLLAAAVIFGLACGQAARVLERVQKGVIRSQ
jgi:hypothetical protein